MVFGSIIDGIVEVIEGFCRMLGNILGVIIILVVLLLVLFACSCLTTGHLPF